MNSKAQKDCEGEQTVKWNSQQQYSIFKDLQSRGQDQTISECLKSSVQFCFEW